MEDQGMLLMLMGGYNSSTCEVLESLLILEVGFLETRVLCANRGDIGVYDDVELGEELLTLSNVCLLLLFILLFLTVLAFSSGFQLWRMRFSFLAAQAIASVWEVFKRHQQGLFRKLVHYCIGLSRVCEGCWSKGSHSFIFPRILQSLFQIVNFFAYIQGLRYILERVHVSISAAVHIGRKVLSERPGELGEDGGWTPARSRFEVVSDKAILSVDGALAGCSCSGGVGVSPNSRMSNASSYVIGLFFSEELSCVGYVFLVASRLDSGCFLLLHCISLEFTVSLLVIPCRPEVDLYFYTPKRDAEL
eukprot:snap_masked-scaffold_15-processed-gene-1.25-mRNA-1 protein AED:1.00 eAED:1.00 QI:0/0/0/0/1/1/3/0/304